MDTLVLQMKILGQPAQAPPSWPVSGRARKEAKRSGSRAHTLTITLCMQGL